MDKHETVIPIGDNVVCDFCNADYTTSEESGGFVFSGNGVCPKCAPKSMLNIKKYNEEKYIDALCPEDMSFGDFIRKYRGPNACIRITGF